MTGQQASDHFKVLLARGAISRGHTEIIRGAVKHFYVSSVRDHEVVKPLLRRTKEGDAIASLGKDSK